MMDLATSYASGNGIQSEDLVTLFLAHGDDLIVGAALLVMDLLACVAIVWLLLGRTVSFRRPTLPAFMVGVYLIMMGVPSILWFADSTDASRYEYLLAVHLVPALLLIGTWLANLCFVSPARTVQRFLWSPFAITRADWRLVPAFVGLLGLATVCVAIYVATAPYVPLLLSLTTYGSLGGDQVRTGIYNSSEVVQYIYAVAVRFLLPVAILYAYLMGHASRVWRFVVFPLVLAFGVFSAALTLERSSAFGLFLVVLVAIYLEHRMSLPPWALALLVVAAAVGGITHQAQYQLDIQLLDLPKYSLSFLGSRVFLDPSYMTSYAFAMHNESLGFLYGSSIRLLSLIGVPYESFSSVGFVADLWVNFAWIGVIIGTLMIGFTLQIVQLLVFHRRTVTALILWAVMLVNAVWLMYGSVLSTMVVTVYSLGVAIGVIARFRGGGVGSPRCVLSAANAGASTVIEPVVTNGR